ncbi:hypothetical protein TRIP_C60528 [Candidatus Zixiibacteriota bacterium]|nr:hypothetical protein TRIP_C60528 [candidate division Zixibacteria bacterium]
MIIKSFTADTVAGALKVIRQEMGGSAIILKTRPCIPAETALTGNRVEVTACVDEKAVVPKGPNAAVKSIIPEPIPVMQNADIPAAKPAGQIPKKVQNFAAKLEKKLDLILNAQYSTESSADFSGFITPLYLNLLDADVPLEVARHLTKSIEERVAAEESIEQVALEILREKIANALAPDFTIEPGMKVAFVGPSGAGKTSALAKLAARLTVEEKKKVTLVSLDNLKVAAFEEIGSYAEMLNVPLANSLSLRKKGSADSIMLIDTPSLSCDGAQVSALARRLMQLKPDIVFLVYSACTRSRDLIDSMIHFESLRPHYLIAGHCDETKRWGGMLTMAEYLEIPLAFISSSSGGNGRLEKPKSEFLARRILRIEGESHAE